MKNHSSLPGLSSLGGYADGGAISPWGEDKPAWIDQRGAVTYGAAKPEGFNQRFGRPGGQMFEPKLNGGITLPGNGVSLGSGAQANGSFPRQSMDQAIAQSGAENARTLGTAMPAGGKPGGRVSPNGFYWINPDGTPISMANKLVTDPNVDPSFRNIGKGDLFSGVRDGFKWVAGNRMNPTSGNAEQDALELSQQWGYRPNGPAPNSGRWVGGDTPASTAQWGTMAGAIPNTTALGGPTNDVRQVPRAVSDPARALATSPGVAPTGLASQIGGTMKGFTPPTPAAPAVAPTARPAAPAAPPPGGQPGGKLSPNKMYWINPDGSLVFNKQFADGGPVRVRKSIGGPLDGYADGGRVTKRDRFIDEQVNAPPKAEVQRVSEPAERVPLTESEKALLEKYRRKTLLEKAKAAIGFKNGGRVKTGLDSMDC